MTTQGKQGAGRYADWSRKSDEWLAEVLRGDDSQDVDAAMEILQNQYQRQLEKYVEKKLPKFLVEDTVQEIWIGLYQGIRARKIENVQAYLRRIARNVRAGAVEKLTRERAIEQDIVLLDDIDAWGDSQAVDDTLEEEEARVIAEHQLDLLKQLPFIDSELSDCQRVFWILRTIYRHPSKAVARLTGKKPGNIDVQTRKARVKAQKYFQSDQFKIALANEDLPKVWEPHPRREGAVVVERFAEALSPQFTPDELKPLGLSLEELQMEYVASLMLPRWHVGQELATGGFSMLLTRREDWEDIQIQHQLLAAGEEDAEAYVQEECVIDVEIEDGHIHLAIHPIVEMLPEDPQQQISTDNTYLSIHSHHLVVPVILGYFDSTLYTPELLARWPFVTPDSGL